MLLNALLAGDGGGTYVNGCGVAKLQIRICFGATVGRGDVKGRY
jgi:hypothetical protein